MLTPPFNKCPNTSRNSISISKTRLLMLEWFIDECLNDSSAFESNKGCISSTKTLLNPVMQISFTPIQNDIERLPDFFGQMI